MLAIKVSGGWRNWWIGNSMPEDIGRVVTFQADGDELKLFLDAMYISAGVHPTVDHTKRRGFFPKEKVELEKKNEITRF